MGRVSGAPSKMWLLVEGGQAGPSNLISGSRRANGKTHNGFSGLCTGALVNAIKKKKEKRRRKKKTRAVYNSCSLPKPFFLANASLGGFISFYYNKLQKVYLICQHFFPCPPGVHFSCARQQILYIRLIFISAVQHTLLFHCLA